MELETSLFGQPLHSLVETLTYSRRLECVWATIEENFSDAALRLEQVSRACGVSRSHLNALLAERVGFSFHELLTRYRLLKAARLLQAKDLTFVEVAVETGFENHASLGRHVQSVFGVSPREFRRRLGQS